MCRHARARNSRRTPGFAGWADQPLGESVSASFFFPGYNIAMNEPEQTDQGRLILCRLDELAEDSKAADRYNSELYNRVSQALIELMRRLGTISLSDAESNAILEKLSELKESLEKTIAQSAKELQQLKREPTAEERAMQEFIDQLAMRQGTVAPNFDALYKRKAELDRKMLRGGN